MPSIFVAANEEFHITLKDKDHPYKSWIDKKLAKQREEYKKPNIILWFEIENKIDPIAPFAIPVTDLDVYEGVMNYEQNELAFKLTFRGKAKANVNSETKKVIDSGQTAELASVSINGEGYAFENAIKTKAIFQSRKM